MANLTDNNIWESGIYQLETNDPVEAGAGGISNRQAQQLANRTSFLKGQIEKTLFNSGVSVVNSTVSLDASYAGKAVLVQGSNDYDIILPSISSMVGNGVAKSITFIHNIQQDRIFRVLSQGSDIISIFNTERTNVHLKPQSSFTLIADLNGWYFIGESPLKDVGRVSSFAVGSVPFGHLLCNGTAVSRQKYQDLFSVIGTTFGIGDGSTTFNLPDLRGEFIRGWDAGRGIDPGRIFGGVQLDMFKGHTHSPIIVGGSAADNGDPGNLIVTANTEPIGAQTNTLGTTGATGGNETRPRNVSLLYTIKY